MKSSEVEETKNKLTKEYEKSLHGFLIEKIEYLSNNLDKFEIKSKFNYADYEELLTTNGLNPDFKLSRVRILSPPMAYMLFQMDNPKNSDDCVIIMETYCDIESELYQSFSTLRRLYDAKGKCVQLVRKLEELDNIKTMTQHLR